MGKVETSEAVGKSGATHVMTPAEEHEAMVKLEARVEAFTNVQCAKRLAKFRKAADEMDLPRSLADAAAGLRPWSSR